MKSRKHITKGVVNGIATTLTETYQCLKCDGAEKKEHGLYCTEHKPAHTPTPLVTAHHMDEAWIAGKLYPREYIVRAVNSHEELINALKSARGYINDWAVVGTFDRIIAKAEGK